MIGEYGDLDWRHIEEAEVDEAWGALSDDDLALMHRDAAPLREARVKPTPLHAGIARAARNEELLPRAHRPRL